MTFIKSDTHFKGVTNSTFCVSKIVCLLIKYVFYYQKLSRIFIVFHAYNASFSAIISCLRWAVQHFTLFMGLSLLFTMCYKAIFKVIYFINISRRRKSYTPWNSVILSANKILLIISIPLWDSIKFIQHLYHHTRHMWQKSKWLSVRILRVMPHRNFKKLRVRWWYYDWY